MYEKEKKFLEQKYILDKEDQHILSNDGNYITFFEVHEPTPIVIIHQSDEEEDGCVCIDLADLEKIISQIKYKI